MKRVLLTGATGFIGRQCVPLLLENGYEVHAVSSKELPEGAPDVHWYRADLLRAGRASELVDKVRPTHLLHLAWYAVPGKFWSAPDNLRWVRASLELVEAFAGSGGRRVVVAGSCAEYDWRFGYCSEGVTPTSPATLYGACKHSLRTVLDSFAQGVGVSAAWGRVFFLFGPHEHPRKLVGSVIRSLLQDQPALCSHGEQVRDFLYVKDVAGAFVALLGSEVSGPVNIGSGQPTALKGLIQGAADLLDRRNLVRLGALPAPADEPPLLVADVGRLRNEVGWSPGYDLRAGLEETVEWWKSRGVISEEHV